MGELRRSSARLLCRRLTASRRRASLGTWRSPSCNRGSCRLRRRCRLRSYTAKCLPEQQAVMLSAGGLGSGTCWTAMHKSPTELAQKAQWRVVTALRLGATPDAGPRSTRALRLGNNGDVCGQSLATHPFHFFAASTGEPEVDRTARSSALCAGSSSRQEVLRAMSLSSTIG